MDRKVEIPTVFEPGRNCQLVTHAHRAALLIDGENYFRAFAQAAERATQSIVIVGWDFDSRTQLVSGPLPSGAPERLGDFLNHLAKRRRIRIYILNWDYPMVFGTDRETRPLYGFGWKPHRRIRFSYDNTHPVGGSHHQKIVVIDDAFAFSGGLDLTCRRWDTSAHSACNDHRVFDGDPYPPFHDAMIAVDGEAARALAAIVRERWTTATGSEIPPVKRANDPWPRELRPELTDISVALSRTMPATAATGEVREVEALYLDMIAAAQRTIYIENQYFTSDRIGAALAARLAEDDPPEIVLVTRLLSHGWLEESTMHVLRTRLLKQLREADRHRRFQAYYPSVPELSKGTCIDVHSKLMIVDDQWLRVGSANLSNRSMGLDTECDVTLEARGDIEHAAAIVAARDRLLAEHLGVSAEEIGATIERTGSLHATIRELHSQEHTLEALENIPEPSAAAMTFASVADPERPVSIEQLVDQFSPDTEVHRKGPAWGKLAIIGVVVVALAAIWRYTPLRDYLTPERVFDWVEQFGQRPWAPIALMLAYTPAAFTMFPRPLITLFAVIAFGPWLGWTYSMSGILLSALATYYAGIALPRDTVRHLAGEKLNQMSEVLRRRGILAAFAVRIVPVAPFAIEGMVAGAIRMKVRDYMIGTFLGMAPGTLTTTVFGDQIQTALEDPSRINYWLVGGVVLLFVVMTLVVRRWFIRENKAAAHHHASFENAGQSTPRVFERA